MSENKNNCVKCDKLIRKNQHAIMCDQCSKWTHRTCQTGVSRVTYLKCVRENASKGKSKGLKRKAEQEKTSDRIKRLRNERVKGLKDVIEKLSEDRCQKLLFMVSDEIPAYLLDIIDELEDQDGTPDRLSPDVQTPDWCVCTHCVDMPTYLERLCCNLRPENCLSQRPEIDQYCLDPGVLDIVYRDVPVIDRDENINRRRRHSTYRQFVMWRFGRLGTGKRVVISSCVVERIRRTFVDRNNQCTGFLVGRLL